MSNRVLLENLKFQKQSQPSSLPSAKSSSKDPFVENEMGHKIAHGIGSPSPRLGKTHPEVFDPFLYTHIFLCSIFMHAKVHSCNKRGSERWSPVKAVSAYSWDRSLLSPSQGLAISTGFYGRGSCGSVLWEQVREWKEVKYLHNKSFSIPFKLLFKFLCTPRERKVAPLVAFFSGQ